ncbi:unnamed protein product [Adineta steineri]|uniref:Uncharacterized protein n=1 Tax=Adineta steineri TaxID=433720 RepID=A0A814CE56_9BILA|nr:unnamed protein product [Adineta steineri]CAF1206793.1 unnamed protein product [Adineta steineri]
MDVIRNVQVAKDDYERKKNKYGKPKYLDSSDEVPISENISSSTSCETKTAKRQVAHAMYLQPVGKIPNFEKLPSSKSHNSEIVEHHLEHAILYQNVTQLMEKREEFALIEDDFGPTLEKLMKDGKTPSFQNLVEACSTYDNTKDIEVHTKKSSSTCAYFMDRGLSQDEAKAYAFAIAFYTGAYSWAMSMEANFAIRRLTKQEQFYSDEARVDGKAAMIMYYLIKGLSHIDFYWGEVIELGLSKYVVLWVDDNIFDGGWENKRHMEKASTLGTRVNVHFVPKSNTESALTFLRSEFGQRLKNSNTFRIVTDMKRTNESLPSTAGVRLIHEARELGFHQTCLIFTGHEESAYEKLIKQFGTKNPEGVKVTQDDAELEKFVIFNGS